MTPIRIAFLGTGPLAGPVFEALCVSGHDVCGLITQPDRTGAGHHRHRNPLKDRALELGLPVLQPARIKRPEAVAELQALRADLFVVAAYGQILSSEILEMPRLGTINVHASILPKYRGATPIHASILNGDLESGVTIIQLVPELDAGPILGCVRCPIPAECTTGELEQQLAQLAPEITLSVVEQLATGTCHPLEQDHSQATHVGKLTKADGQISWHQSAVQVERHLRGMHPWPGAFSLLQVPNKSPLRLQFLQGKVLDDPAGDGGPGTVTAVVAQQSFVVACGSGALEILRVHPEGKKPMTAGEFLRGRPLQVGDRFE